MVAMGLDTSETDSDSRPQGEIEPQATVLPTRAVLTQLRTQYVSSVERSRLCLLIISASESRFQKGKVLREPCSSFKYMMAMRERPL